MVIKKIGDKVWCQKLEYICIYMNGKRQENGQERKTGRDRQRIKERQHEIRDEQCGNQVEQGKQW